MSANRISLGTSPEVPSVFWVRIRVPIVKAMSEFKKRDLNLMREALDSPFRDAYGLDRTASAVRQP